MERDWNTIRTILLKLEAMEPPKNELRLADFPEEKNKAKLSHQFELIIDDSLVKSKLDDTLSEVKDHALLRLTVPGHDLLDKMRDDTVWKKVMPKVTELGVAMTIEILLALIKKYTVGD